MSRQIWHRSHVREPHYTEKCRSRLPYSGGLPGLDLPEPCVGRCRQIRIGHL